MAIGRISGPLLKSNLLRNGVDLAFETDLLYLDVNNRRIGVKTTTPQYPLDVAGIARVTDLEITNPVFTIGNVTINGSTNTISTTAQEFRIATTDSVIIGNRVLVGDLEINDSFIENTNTNSDLYIRANGTGEVNIEGNTVITGNLHATGNITADGDIQIGDEDTDTITINAEIASDIIPDANDTYTIGTADKRWQKAYLNTTYVDTITTNDIDFGDLEITSTPGNVIYVSNNGSDTATGAHPQDPVRTIEMALSIALPGDTVFLYPGQYEEIFPLTVGQGVTVRGQSLRSVEITPDSTSQSEDAFLLSGESTVEEVTIKNFYYDSLNDKGYAFRFAPDLNVTLRSPYVRNVTVITHGTTVTSSDPRGFDSGDAGCGVFLDGSVALPSSKEATMLFHAVTFITPGVTGLKATNGARIEWLNSFTYFADKGMNLYDSADGLAGNGKTRLKLLNLNGSVVPGEIINYYDTDGSTIISSGTVDSIDGSYVYLDGKVTGFELPPTRAKKTVSAKNGTAIKTAQYKFGSSSILFDGTDDYAEVITQTDFGFGTDDLSVEGWFRLNSLPAVAATLFDFRAGSALDTSAMHLYLNSSGNLNLAIGNTDVITTFTTLTTGTWYHIAVSRVGTNLKIYLNGSSIGNATDSSDLGTTKPLRIGGTFSGANNLHAYVDDFRVRKGEGYSSNFTAPTSTLPVTIDTVLMLRGEGENNSQVILDDDEFIQDIRFSGGSTAEKFELVDLSDFGAELRSIASACVYGNYGVYADGEGVVAYLIGQNLAYIGNGKEVDNDTTTVLQDQEIVKLNGANVYYSTVDQKGDFRVGDLFRVNQETGEVSFTNAEFLFNNNNGITFTDGVNTTIIDGSKVQTGNIKFSGNTIESIVGDLNFDAATGVINLEDNVNISGDLDVTGNVTIGGNITLGDAATDSIQITAAIDSDLLPAVTDTYNIGRSDLAWEELHVGRLYVDELEINDNYIQSNSSDGNINLITNAAGEIIIDDLRFKDNVISNNSGSIILSPSSDTVEIQGTGSLILPKGSTADRPGTPEVGMIRFNTDSGIFEAYDGGWTELGGVYDIDRDTYITPELTPGANDNTLRFYAGGALVADVNTERFDVVKLEVDDIEISGNTLQTITTNQDLELRANGTGTISIENFAFNGGTITNLVDGDVTTLEQIGTGYFKVPGTGGFVIPSGNNEERHPTPEVGMVRYNTVEDRVEVYDIGGNWSSVAGSTGAVSFNDAEDIAIKFALTL
jgi:hypothetical protein